MASQTKTCNLYNTGVAYGTSPANMVDGNVSTFASTVVVNTEQYNHFTTGQLFSIPAGSTVTQVDVAVQHYEGGVSSATAVGLIIDGVEQPFSNLTNRSVSTEDVLVRTTGMPTATQVNNDGTDGFGIVVTHKTLVGKVVSSNVSRLVVTVTYTEPSTAIKCAETVGFVDTVKKRDARKITQTLALSDQLSKRGRLFRTEAFIVADRLAKRLLRPVRETISVAHAITVLGGTSVVSKIVEEALKLVDTLSRKSMFFRTREEVSLSDRLVKTLAMRMYETRAFADRLVKSLVRRNFDTATISHEIRKHLARPVFEGITLSDRLFKRIRISCETHLLVVDVPRKNFVRPVVQPLAVVDRISKQIQSHLSESFVIAHAITTSTAAVLTRVIGETVKFVDSARKALGMKKSETFRIAHEISTSVEGVLSRLLTETMGFVDVISRRTMRRAFSEDLSIACEIARNFSKRVRESFWIVARTPFAAAGVQLAEVISFAISVVTGGRWFRTFTETASFVDSIRKATTLQLNQQATFVIASYRKFIAMKFATSVFFSHEIRKGQTRAFIDTLGVSYAISKDVTSRRSAALVLVDNLSRAMTKRFTMVISFEDGIRKHHRHLEVTSVIFSHAMSKYAAKVVSETLVFEDRIAREMRLLLTQLLSLDDTLRVATVGLALILAEAIRFSCEMPKSLFRRFLESLRFADVATPAPPLTIEVGWLGSYPRPSPAAPLVFQLQREDGQPIADARVTAYVYAEGLLLSTVSMVEQSTAGVYRGTFPIKRTDPVGTYPVTIIAEKGIHHISTVTYEGYVNVYVEMSRSISFH